MKISYFIRKNDINHCKKSIYMRYKYATKYKYATITFCPPNNICVIFKQVNKTLKSF